MYTHREPVEAFKNGVLGRAQRQETKEGSGRTVPMGEFASQHSSIQDSMVQIQNKYKNDPRVQLSVLDNSRGPGGAVASRLEDLPKNPSREELMPKLRATLDDARAKGTISDRIYHATKGKEAQGEVGM